MTDVKQDILGKISAIVEKRDTEVLFERTKVDDDFPMLTEIIDNDSVHSPIGTISLPSYIEPDVSGFVERRQRSIDRRKSVNGVPNYMLTDDNYHLLIQTIEQHMMVILSRHQKVLEDELRQLIKDEVGRIVSVK